MVQIEVPLSVRKVFQVKVDSKGFESVATGYESGDDNEDDWNPKMDEMFKFFYEMIKTIEKFPGNNFKKSAELEMKKMIEIANQMKEERDEEIEKFVFYSMN